VQLVEDGQATPTNDRDQGVDLRVPQRLQQAIGFVHLLDHAVFIDPADMKGIDLPGLAHVGSNLQMETLGQIPVEGRHSAVGIAIGMKQAGESVPDADHLPPQLVRRQCSALQHGVHPGYEARTCVHADALLWHRSAPCSLRRCRHGAAGAPCRICGYVP
jgi:hypothetical protein